MARDQDIAAAIMRNARAAWRDQLRNQVTRETPGLDPAGVEARVAELVSETRAAAGRRGAASTRRSALAARYVLDRHAEVADMARDLLAALEQLADPTAGCAHIWPAAVDADGYCSRCGLAYTDYTGRAVAA